MPTILIDADGCPVVDLTVRVGQTHGVTSSAEIALGPSAAFNRWNSGLFANSKGVFPSNLLR